MGVISIFADGVGLMLGSLLAAALLSLSCWWMAERAHRAWVAQVLLAMIVAGLLVSPLEESLFVRMVAVFSLVGAGLLWFVGREGAVLAHERDGAMPGTMPNVAFPAAQDL